MPGWAIAIGIAVMAGYSQTVGAAEAGTGMDAVSRARLMDIYLDCERRAQDEGLDGGDAIRCSETYEQLKQQAFDGDFSRMRKWYAGRMWKLREASDR